MDVVAFELDSNSLLTVKNVTLLPCHKSSLFYRILQADLCGNQIPVAGKWNKKKNTVLV